MACKTLYKTLCKTPCISLVNLRVQLFYPHTYRVKSTFSTHFFYFYHRLYHHHHTPVNQLFYPLFHRPYYYNDNYLFNRKEVK